MLPVLPETWPPSSSVELFTALHSPGGCTSLLSTECVAYIIAHCTCKGPTLDLMLCIKVLSHLNKGIVLLPWAWFCPWSPSFQTRASLCPLLPPSVAHLPPFSQSMRVCYLMFSSSCFPISLLPPHDGPSAFLCVMTLSCTSQDQSPCLPALCLSLSDHLLH